ncbi:hypothetical protein Ahia01_000496500 [Argonauta hians]
MSTRDKMDFYNYFRPFIVKHLDLIDKVIDHLLSEELITDANYEDITSQKKESDKIRKMLDILIKRRCSPEKFRHILKKSENYTLLDLITSETLNKKESDKIETFERKVYIFQGFDQNDTICKHFSQSISLFKKLDVLPQELKVLPDNKFRYIDTIVLCNRDYINLQVKDLGSLFIDIKKIVSDQPERVFTFLLIVEGEDVGADNIYNKDDENLIIKVLNTESLKSFLDNFSKSNETFDVYVRNVIQGRYVYKATNEVGNRRKIFFLCNSNDETRNLLSKFQQLPMCEAQTISSLQEMDNAQPTDYEYYDIIAWCWDQIANIQNHHLNKIIQDIVTFRKIRQEISTTFLLLVDKSKGGGDDNIDARVVVDESENLIAKIPKHNFDKFLNGFFDNKNNFNSYPLRQLLGIFSSLSDALKYKEKGWASTLDDLDSNIGWRPSGSATLPELSSFNKFSTLALGMVETESTLWKSYVDDSGVCVFAFLCKHTLEK